MVIGELDIEVIAITGAWYPHRWERQVSPRAFFRIFTLDIPSKFGSVVVEDPAKENWEIKDISKQTNFEAVHIKKTFRLDIDETLDKRIFPLGYIEVTALVTPVVWNWLVACMHELIVSVTIKTPHIFAKRSVSLLNSSWRYFSIADAIPKITPSITPELATWHLLAYLLEREEFEKRVNRRWGFLTPAGGAVKLTAGVLPFAFVLLLEHHIPVSLETWAPVRWAPVGVHIHLDIPSCGFGYGFESDYGEKFNSINTVTLNYDNEALPREFQHPYDLPIPQLHIAAERINKMWLDYHGEFLFNWHLYSYIAHSFGYEQKKLGKGYTNTGFIPHDDFSADQFDFLLELMNPKPSPMPRALTCVINNLGLKRLFNYANEILFSRERWNNWQFVRYRNLLVRRFSEELIRQWEYDEDKDEYFLSNTNYPMWTLPTWSYRIHRTDISYTVNRYRAQQYYHKDKFPQPWLDYEDIIDEPGNPKFVLACESSHLSDVIWAAHLDRRQRTFHNQLVFASQLPLGGISDDS